MMVRSSSAEKVHALIKQADESLGLQRRFHVDSAIMRSRLALMEGKNAMVEVSSIWLENELVQKTGHTITKSNAVMCAFQHIIWPST